MDAPIPKNIFQTWKTQQVPFYLRPYVATWKRLPNYNYKLYDDTDMDAFVLKHYPSFYTEYEALIPVEKTDIFRLMVVYEYGGMYTDLDTSLNCNLDELYASHVEAEVILGIETDTTEEESQRLVIDYCYALCNWTFAARAKHPFIKEAIEKVIYNIRHQPNLYTTLKTGPRAFTDAYLAFEEKSSIVVLPIKYFGAGQKHSHSPPLEEGYILHHFLNSWTRKKRSWLNRFFYWYRSFFRR